MKILFLTYQVAGVGGGYIRAFSLARQLVRKGHEVVLIASRTKPGLSKRVSVLDGVRQIEMPDLMPHRVRHGGLSPFDILFRSFWVLFSKPFDVIHMFEHRPAVMLPGLIHRWLKRGLLISDWADLWGKEGIAAERTTLVERVLGRLDDYFETRSRGWVDGVTAISDDLNNRLAHIGIPKAQRMILPPGANLDMIKSADPADARRKLGLPSEARIIAYSGYAPYDQQFLTQVVIELLRNDLELMVISSGRVIDPLPAEVIRDGLNKRWIQYGSLPISENGNLLAAADVLLLPYLNTSINRGRFPNKFGDFLAAGRPIVSHPTGDMGALMARERLGVLSSEDPKVFAADVLNLLDSRNERERSGLHARRFAEQKWSWASRAREIDDFYSSLLS